MSRLSLIYYSFLIIVCAQSGHANSENQLFYDGVRAEASKDFDSAISFYEKSAQMAHSSNLYGNLANLYFKKGMFGRSILNYRKALLLAPQNRELAANLSFVRETARIKSSSMDNQSSYFNSSSLNRWTVFTVLTLWVGLLALGMLLFFQIDPTLKALFVLAWLCLCSVGSWAIIKAESNHDLQSREVIALSSTSNDESNSSQLIHLRKAAFEGSATNSSVFPGESLFCDLGRNTSTKEEKIKRHTNSIGEVWYYVRNFEGKKWGWVRQEKLGRIVQPNQN
jgi:tetratricopeptide (TPR) repeat protein